MLLTTGFSRAVLIKLATVARMNSAPTILAAHLIAFGPYCATVAMVSDGAIAGRGNGPVSGRRESNPRSQLGKLMFYR